MHNLAHELASCGNAFSALSTSIADPEAFGGVEGGAKASALVPAPTPSQFTRLLHALVGNNAEFLSLPLFKRGQSDSNSSAPAFSRNTTAWTWVQLLAFGVFFENPNSTEH